MNKDMQDKVQALAATTHQARIKDMPSKDIPLGIDWAD